MSAFAHDMLHRSFGTLIDEPGLTEIVVNMDGTVWVERAGSLHMERTDIALDGGTIRHLAQDLAGDQPISETTPLAGAEFRIDDAIWRSQIVTRPVIEGNAALALRRTVSEARPLLTLIDGCGSMDEVFEGMDTDDMAVFDAHDRQDLSGFLGAAIAARWNIVFSGGTSSGKTTWVRACLGLIPITERLLTIEDVLELRAAQPNVLAMKTSSSASSTALLRASLRLRPDRIVMGELRGAEAWDYLSAINSGHPGGLTTLHATSPDAALSRLALMVLEAGRNMTYSDVREYCRTMIDVVIQLRKSGDRRKVSGIEIFRERPSASRATAKMNALRVGS